MKQAVNPLVSIIVPVYNERRSLHDFLPRLESALRGWNRRTEIVFVDDASSDGSGMDLERFCAGHPGARLVRHATNQGRGKAVLTAMGRAKGDVLVTIDADLENPPESIPPLVGGMAPDTACVTGYRRGRPRTDLRGAASAAYNIILGMLTGQCLHDCNCGLKAYRSRDLRRPFIRSWLEKDGDYLRFVVLLFRKSNCRVTEHAIPFSPRGHGRSKYRWKRYLKAGRDLLRLTAAGMRPSAGGPPAARTCPEALDFVSDIE